MQDIENIKRLINYEEDGLIKEGLILKRFFTIFYNKTSNFFFVWV